MRSVSWLFCRMSLIWVGLLSLRGWSQHVFGGTPEVTMSSGTTPAGQRGWIPPMVKVWAWSVGSVVSTASRVSSSCFLLCIRESLRVILKQCKAPISHHFHSSKHSWVVLIWNCGGCEGWLAVSVISLTLISWNFTLRKSFLFSAYFVSICVDSLTLILQIIPYCYYFVALSKWGLRWEAF